MSSAGTLPATESNACYAVFHDDYLAPDADPLMSLPSSSPTSQDASVQSTKRLQSTRQKLGGYRHDLLVAMRVVNSIEREVIQGEYEKFAMQEHARCRAVAPLVNSTNSDALTSRSGSKAEQKALANWYKEYCVSCSAEYERIMGDGGM